MFLAVFAVEEEEEEKDDDDAAAAAAAAAAVALVVLAEAEEEAVAAVEMEERYRCRVVWHESTGTGENFGAIWSYCSSQ